MAIKFYNSMTGYVEDFHPIDNTHVTMYVCGPTVYDRIHLGNARSVVIFDILHRLMRHHYPSMTYVRNITDIDDKINERALERGISIQNLTNETIKMFHEDIKTLDILDPDIEPRATDHINEMINMIQILIDKKHAYATSDGHVMFDVNTLASYGELSHRNLEQMIAGARVEVASRKKNPCDFVLWKPSNKGIPGWESPWGYGRPGWHIECSAMSRKYLGNSFDIHGGGRDLIFPHHENEIAQSKGCYGNDSFAHYWIHNEMLTVDGEKMSKSLGNFVTLHEALKYYNGEVIRFMLMSTHYRKPLDWTNDGLEQAKKILDKFYTALDGYSGEMGTVDSRIINALDADLNTPLAISYLHELASEIHKSLDNAKKIELQQMLKASGLFLGLLRASPQDWFQTTKTGSLSSSEIEELIAQRAYAKAKKDFTTADAIRNKLEADGVALLDSPDGTTWRRI